uniref:Terpene synthase 7 n=1 Tax=Stevia rebaudiana TaxID=55670 RepID=A0A8F9WMX7_STERE|nr:terpene synthase 7 [Stevia rebaudiana]
MSTLPISSAPFSSSSLPPVYDINNKHNVARNTVTSHPSIWGDQFLTYDEKEDFVIEKQLVEELKGEVRKMLMLKPFEPMQYVNMVKVIDVIQRLGLSYHFDGEIEDVLQHIYTTYGNNWIDEKNLESVSLWFRLLRQQGFNVSSETFKNHTEENGNFKETLCNDVQGMLALYEAAYMRVEGEQVLDEALEFTKTHLAIIAKDPSCDSLSRAEIQRALNLPLRRTLPRLGAVGYIPIYQQQPTHNEVLLKLAKLDFNILQSMHKKELSQLCKWWKDLDLGNRLPYVRDRCVEGYFWILAIYFEPEHYRTRMFLLKTCMWLVVLDDTVDNYATYEEFEIFTQAVERWSISCLDMLPEYMKLIYQQLLNHHDEMEESLEKEGKAYQIHYVKEAAKDFVRSGLLEAKWLKEGYKPTLDEYISNASITIGQHVIIARSYVGRGDMVTEETFRWLATYPPLVKSSSLIFRLMDDLVTHQREQERDHIPSCIECYIKETGASKEEACVFFAKQVEDAWKVINRASLRPTDIPFSLLSPIINITSVIHVFYGGNDNYGHAGEEMIGYIKSLLVHPMVV